MAKQEHRDTLVVGLGKTGLSCARFLAARGVSVAVNDSRREPPGLAAIRRELPDLPVRLGSFDEALFAAADRLVVSPGVSLREPVIQEALARGVEVLGDIELFARHARAPVLAITGSNGKSTVTTLVGDMARRAGVRVAVGGNLGKPALDLLADDIELYVLELSSFQLETTASLCPRAAAVLNLSADHMDRYDSLEAYARAKARVLHCADTAVVNLDDPRVRAMPGGTRRVGFTLGVPDADDYGVCVNQGVDWLCRGGAPLLPAGALHAPGLHNRANALAALALGEAAGVPLEAMRDALRAFTGLPHRTRFVGEVHGVRWFNDSKGTNPGASAAALAGLDPGDGSRAVLIAGGDCKGAAFDELAEAVAVHARAVVAMGRDAGKLAEGLGDGVHLAYATDMADAVQQAAQLARPGDRVLLSPACASFDMYRNYEHRGEVYEGLVRELGS
ncbi:MAG: UDP-N-acetylmuramoyl-L-alanine--D-glutamate ligase [Pseudomonadota bacterium]